MPNRSDILKLRILLCFLKTGRNGCNVTGISKTLIEEKYTISRMLIAMEKEGLIDRSDMRNPVLTEKGKEEAWRFSERIDITLSYLMYEGVDIENARKDAFHWALYSTDKTMEVIFAVEERHRVKNELSAKKCFNGETLCRKLKNASYQFPFMLYRNEAKNGKNISMANEGFEHPCVLYVEEGVGNIRLRAVGVNEKSGLTGRSMFGRVQSLQYFDNGIYCNAEKNGDVLSFPAKVLSFVNVGSGPGQVLHGSVRLKMECSVGTVHMPDSEAVFTMII